MFRWQFETNVFNTRLVQILKVRYSWLIAHQLIIKGRFNEAEAACVLYTPVNPR